MASTKTGVFQIRAMLPPLSQSAGHQSVPGLNPRETTSSPQHCFAPEASSS
jgi:hypothetical protein